MGNETKPIYPACPPRSSPLRIAVLLDYLNFFGRGYEGQLRDALHARCLADGHDLFMLYGGPLDGPDPLERADNVIFELIRPDSFDGIIVVSPLLSAHCGPEGVGRLIERYRPAHLCSVGMPFPGVPSLLLDNRGGMEAAVQHLVRDHGCRHPAFLAGTPQNPEATARFQAYKDVLARNGIGLDPSLVESGCFLPSLGRQAMEAIIARGVPFDGVVAANDSMALGAIQALQKSGRRVPQDTPVTGFDDLMLGRLGSPPLTTVAQPFELLADLAIKTIADQVAGRPVDACTQVATEFIRRQSCGCSYGAQGQASGVAAGVRWVPRTLVHERIQALKPALASLLQGRASDGSLAADRLIFALIDQLAGQKEAFQSAVVELLGDAGDDSEGHQMLHSAINCLRSELCDEADLQLERAFYDGLSLVTLAHTTAQVQHRLGLDENYLQLLTVSEHASLALDLPSLREALVKGLPAAGVRTAILSCPQEGSPGELASVVCLVRGAVRESRVGTFPSSQLIPPDILATDRGNTLLVFPLTHEGHLLGVIAFDHADGNNACIAFRNEIASVLKSIRLHQEWVQKTLLHERGTQERLATTRRMEALSILAGGVAHDLNNVLSPLVALPDVILHALRDLAIDADVFAEIAVDIENVKTASLRATQTIKDLLTLGRQGRTAKDNLDLNRLVKSCLADSFLRLANGAGSQVNMRLELHPDALTINGAESQLVRAIANLTHNAVEAIEGNGEVLVRTTRVYLAAPMAGHETIPPGDYAVLVVSDNGCGIAPHEINRVFEPFFTKKRTRENSGSGLGLAIVHGVVKEHAGFIDVTSTPEVGTAFSLFFPLAQGIPRGREQFPSTPRGHARILVVDDEPLQLRTCRRVLARFGYEVDVLESGLGAYELFNQAANSGKSPFDLVIMDMVLNEGLDGLQVVELIQRLFPCQKVMVLSGHAPDERAELAMRKGLPWLAKPYTIDALALAVDQVLQGHGP